MRSDPGMPGLSSHRAQRCAVEQLDGGDRGRLEPRHGAAGGLEAIEEDQRARLVGVLVDGQVGDLADEAERAFRADHQVGEDVERVGEIDQRVEAVAGGVLEPELVADALRPARIGARRRGQARPAARAGRPWLFAEAGAAVRHPGYRARVPSASTRRMAGERVIAVLRRAAAHAAGVVGGDAADRRGVDRGRVRADLAAVAAPAGGWRRRRCTPG